jgi:hypothetical protein
MLTCRSFFLKLRFIIIFCNFSFRFNVRSYVAKLLGVELCELEGISEVTVTELIAGIGIDINQRKNERIYRVVEFMS